MNPPTSSRRAALRERVMTHLPAIGAAFIIAIAVIGAIVYGIVAFFQGIGGLTVGPLPVDPPTGAVLAIITSRDGSTPAVLTRLDALSLRPQGSQLGLRRYHGVWSSPRLGSEIAIGASDVDRPGRGIQIIEDLDASGGMRQIPNGAAVRAVGWVSPPGGAVAALTVPRSAHGSGPTHPRGVAAAGELRLFNAFGTRLARRPFSASRACRPPSGETLGGFVVLVSGAAGAAPLLVRLNAAGRYHTATLDGLPGEVRDGACGGIAVDVWGERAYVVAAGARIAEVDSRTMAVRYSAVRVAAPSRRCRRSRSCVPRRSAIWLDNGLLAVFGSDAIKGAAGRAVGVHIVDPARGTSRVLDEGARFAQVADDRLLTYGGARRGLRGYALGGSPRWARFDGRRVSDVQLAGVYAYVRLGSRVEILNSVTGRTLARAPAPPFQYELLETSAPAP